LTLPTGREQEEGDWRAGLGPLEKRKEGHKSLGGNGMSKSKSKAGY